MGSGDDAPGRAVGSAPGFAQPFTGEDSVDGSLNTIDLANGAVTTLKLRNQAVTVVKLRTGAVTEPKLAS